MEAASTLALALCADDSAVHSATERPSTFSATPSELAARWMRNMSLASRMRSSLMPSVSYDQRAPALRKEVVGGGWRVLCRLALSCSKANAASTSLCAFGSVTGGRLPSGSASK